MELLILVISNYDAADLQVYFEYLLPFIITNFYFVASTRCNDELSNHHSNILAIIVSKLLECLLARCSLFRQKSGAGTVLQALHHSFALIPDRLDVPAGTAPATPTGYRTCKDSTFCRIILEF